MEFLKVIILALILVFLAIAGLALRILIKKDGKFPNIHVSRNKSLARQGIFCAGTQDRIEQSKLKKHIDYKKVRYSHKD
jgi:signal-transduction protein with cAMP-binding, CBS, and nucleotidyltransferase domain